MAFVFPSEEWLKEYERTIQEKPDYKEGGKDWRAGAIVLIVNAQPEVGIPEPFRMYMDLHEGQCRGCKTVSEEEADSAPFAIKGDYERWKAIVKAELEPVKAIMQGKLRLRGSLPTIVRSIDAAKALVRCATYIDTVFIDEQ